MCDVTFPICASNSWASLSFLTNGKRWKTKRIVLAFKIPSNCQGF